MLENEIQQKENTQERLILYKGLNGIDVEVTLEQLADMPMHNMVNGVAFQMTSSEIAEITADWNKPPKVPFEKRIRLQYQALPVSRQLKYQQDLLMAAFQLDRGNPLMVAVNILLAEYRIVPGEDDVQQIVDAAKTELGAELMAIAEQALKELREG